MVFLNGEFIPKDQASISVMDRGFLFGDGVYEVIPVYNNQIFRLDEHLALAKQPGFHPYNQPLQERPMAKNST